MSVGASVGVVVNNVIDFCFKQNFQKLYTQMITYLGPARTYTSNATLGK